MDRLRSIICERDPSPTELQLTDTEFVTFIYSVYRWQQHQDKLAFFYLRLVYPECDLVPSN
jgi:hypothetical protein